MGIIGIQELIDGNSLSENFRALFYAPFYAAHAIGAYQAEGVEVELLLSPDPARTAAALRAARSM